jgi:plastocyanin
MKFSVPSGLMFAITAAMLAWSCGSSYSSDSNPAAPSGSGGPTVTVAIGSGFTANSFNPNPVPASVGQTVAFKNNDTSTHHLVFDSGAIDIGDIAPGATSKTITVPAGSGNFHCTNHPTMVGAINGPVPTAPPCDPSYGYC